MYARCPHRLSLHFLVLITDMTQPPKFPPWLLILDISGTLLLCLGLFGQFGGDNVFSLYAIPLIVVGALMMLPLLIFLVARSMNR